MMMSLSELIKKHRLNITGIVHAGARLGEEAAQYRENGINRVWWIEANPEVIPQLRFNVEPLGHKVIEALLYENDGVELPFHVTNHSGMSSSILEFGTHTSFSKDTHFVKHLTLVSSTLDSLVQECGIRNCNMLVMDLQGAELHCLRGARQFLQGVDVVFTEVNKDEVYVGCAKIHELDAFLADFERRDTYWCGDQGWGDAILVRRGR